MDQHHGVRGGDGGQPGAPRGRGALRVYLGAAPGVGKTFRMLDEGRRRPSAAPTWWWPSSRPTAAPHRWPNWRPGDVPRVDRAYRGAHFGEMDLDAVLARRPEVALVDELPHTNPPGGRNDKRWQDVEVLLDAGIDVVTTVNIQHLESLNDVVEKITGGAAARDRARRGGPPRRPDRAGRHDPEALRRRMAHGNIYTAEKVDAALANYFRVGNLTALRELALLWVAGRVDEALHRYRGRARHRAGLGGQGAGRGRADRRPGGRHADPPGRPHRRPRGRRRAARGARRPQRRAGRPATSPRPRWPGSGAGGEPRRQLPQVVGDDVPAGPAGVRPRRERHPDSCWAPAGAAGATADAAGGSRRHQAVPRLRDIDVHMVTPNAPGGGRLLPAPGAAPADGTARRWWPARLAGWAARSRWTGAAGLRALPRREPLTLTSDALLFLLAWSAWRASAGCGRRWSPSSPRRCCSTGSSPRRSTVDHRRARRTSWRWPCSSWSRARSRSVVDRWPPGAAAGGPRRGRGGDPGLAGRRRAARRRGADAVLVQLGEARDDLGACWSVDPGRGRQLVSPTAARRWSAPADGGPAVRCRSSGGDGAGAARALAAGRRPAGAGGVRGPGRGGRGTARLRRGRRRGGRPGRRERRMRTALLAAVSHDLRTPLAVGSGRGRAACAARTCDFAEQDREELLATAEESLARLSRLVDNLLDMSRLQAGALPLRLAHHVPGGGAARGAGVAVRRRAGRRDDRPGRPPAVSADPALLERVIANVVKNAVRHARPAARWWSPPARGRPGRDCGWWTADRAARAGPRARLRALPADRRPPTTGAGVGLGLAVARGLAEAMRRDAGRRGHPRRRPDHGAGAARLGATLRGPGRGRILRSCPPPHRRSDERHARGRCPDRRARR